MTGEKITVLLADDHLIVRQGLRALLDLEADIRVVGEASDGVEALELVKQFRPDVLVVDLVMPKMSGLEAARQLKYVAPETRAVILSMHSSEPYILEALHSGAQGYVLKTAGATELAKAVRTVASGRHYLTPDLSDVVVEAYLGRVKETAIDPYDTLTGREREVLSLAVDGLTNAEIGAKLSISPATAMTHRTNLMRKLNLHNQTQLVQYAVGRGLVIRKG